MKYGFVSIYYSQDLGYIIVSYATLKDSAANVVMNPVNVKEKTISEDELGIAIKEAMQKSCDSSPMELRECPEFWKIKGIKGFSAFSKKFRSINIEQNENCYELIEWLRDKDGSYVPPKDFKTEQLPLSASVKELGMIVRQMLSGELKREDDSIFSFQTLNENTVTYTRPGDDFEDRGDGHTDAYQIFTHETHNKNYIAFLIDNNYSEISEDGVKFRWNQLYGELFEYQYEEINNKELKIVIKGKTKEVELKSYFYQDGEDLMEVLIEIDIVHTPKEFQQEIKMELEKVIGSINIV